MNQPPIDYNAPDYKRSRTAYLIHCAFEHFGALLIADAFLAKLLLHIGMTDAQVGIVSGFVTLACLYQLLSMVVVQRITNTKRFVLTFYNLGRMLFVLLFTVPFWPIADAYKSVVCVLCILVGYLGYYLANTLVFPWGNAYVDPAHRAEYSSGKEMVSLMSGMVVTLIIGYAMDAFEAGGNVENGFIFCGVSLLIFCICDFICMANIKNRNFPKSDKKPAPMKLVLKKTLGNRSFRNMVIVSTVYNIAAYVTVGFLGTYRLSELAFTVGTIQVLNIVGSLIRFALSKPIGRYSDRTSFARGIKLGMIFSAIGYGVCIFTTPDTRLLAVVSIICLALSQAGTGQNFINSTYNYVESEYFVHAEAIKNSIGGGCGFLISLVSGKFLSWIQANGNMFLGMHVYGQQVLAAITTVLIIGCIIFMHTVIEKQEVMVQ